jgi:predicted nucleotidyltransferase
VVLYGSYARGDFHEWSDVDIMVLADVDGPEGRRLEALLSRRLEALSFHMNLLLSLFVTPYRRFVRMKEVYPFYRNVDEEGKRLCWTNSIGVEGPFAHYIMHRPFLGGVL